MTVDYNSKRTHDSFYKDEDHYTNPKEYFKKGGAILLKEFIESNLNTINYLDIGCAAADFLRYVSSISQKDLDINYFGADVMNELLIEAKKRFPKGNFEYADLSIESNGVSNIFKRKFDFITMLGVHMIFDELFWLDNIIDSLNNGGKAIIYGFFNPYPYDVFVRVKKSGDNHHEPGWNVHSKETVRNFCKLRGVSCDFEDFEPNVNLSRNSNDALRTWNMLLDKNDKQADLYSSDMMFENNRTKIFTNATRIIHDWSFCLIHK